MSKVLFLILILSIAAHAQIEILSNADIVLMTKSGLSKELIARKIKFSSGAYDTTARALIELKNAGVADDVIELLLDAGSEKTSPPALNQTPAAANRNLQTAPASSYSESGKTTTIENRAETARVLPDSKDAASLTRTIAITKSTINPSRQALEKELLKREEWKNLNLNIIRYKESADLYVEIGFVPLSIITHRYVFRIYERRSGTVLAAGETTSWGSLAENLAREISKKLLAANGK